MIMFLFNDGPNITTLWTLTNPSSHLSLLLTLPQQPFLLHLDHTVMTHDSSYNKCSYITPTLSHLIPLRSDENPQRTFYFLHHDEPAVASYNAQHRTKDYVSLIEVLLNVPLTFATLMLQTTHPAFYRA